MGYKWTVLVGRERGTKSTMATTVPTKGESHGFAVDKMREFIRENGDQQGAIIVKTDQESSVKYAVRGLAESREEGKTIPEESPVGSSQSNGVVERAVQEIDGRFRAIYLGLQDRIGIRCQRKNSGFHTRLCCVSLESDAGRGRRQSSLPKDQG